MTAKKHARSESQAEDDPALKHPSTKRAKEIDQDPPYGKLTKLLKKASSDSKPKNVLHWFRSKDIRAEDNKGLHAASQKAKEGDGNLITMYLHSPKDLEWHGTSAARTDFLLESLKILKSQLEEKHIPLAILTAEERGDKTRTVLDFIQQHDITHVFANLEYEVDELRRDIQLLEQLHADHPGVTLTLLHDQTVVEPGTLTTGSSSPHKVFTPYHRDWVSHVIATPSLLTLAPPPSPNPSSASSGPLKELFASSVPPHPASKPWPEGTERARIRELWPAGHAAGVKRLEEFLRDKAPRYAGERSMPGADVSSRMSAYFSAGIVSVREAVAAVAGKKLGDGKGKSKDADGEGEEGGVSSDALRKALDEAGPAAWVREIVFREFYRHTMIGSPHDGMNLPHNLKFDFVEWADDEEGWSKWCDGTTGVPFVDAGMRQLRAEAYMHNRCRMNTASYLRANLLIDYRRGERFFAEHLVDWDLCNNTQGWEPSYTIFNPVVQAEKCDPDGEYIRKWVPELKDVKGKAIFAPHERLSKAEFEKLGYPEPHVDFKETQQRAKEVYKRDLAEADP